MKELKTILFMIGMGAFGLVLAPCIIIYFNWMIVIVNRLSP
jgi:hypothetical protein